MKSFKYILFPSFLLIAYTFGMEQKSFGDLPKDIWAEIAKYGVNKNGKTEKEIFKDLDSLRLTSKTTKEGVDAAIKKTAKELSKNPEAYSYYDFKADIIDEIIKERKNVAQKEIDSLIFNEDNKNGDAIVVVPVILDSFNWFNNKLKGRKFKQNSYLVGNINNLITKEAAFISPKMLEYLLKQGASADMSWGDERGGGEVYYYNSLYHMLKALKDFLYKERDKNLSSHADYYATAYNYFKNPNYIDNWMTNLKLLIKYGAKPSQITKAVHPTQSWKEFFANLVVPVSFNRYGNSIENAKDILLNYWRYALSPKNLDGSIATVSASEAAKIEYAYRMGKTNNDPLIPKLQEIVKILENSVKKSWW